MPEYGQVWQFDTGGRQYTLMLVRRLKVGTWTALSIHEFDYAQVLPWGGLPDGGPAIEGWTLLEG